jgi:hypothetical protein
MPRFVITVIEGDGTPWDKIDLHELYEIGEFDHLTFTDPQQELKNENLRLMQENNNLLKMLATMQGQIEATQKMVAAMVGAKAPAAQGGGK